MTPDGFFKATIDQPIDVDKFPAGQVFQCYDLWAKFDMMAYNRASPLVIGPSGYAKDLWNNFDGLGLGDRYTKVTGTPQDGDWAIYGDAPATPTSHVGMFRLDNGDGTITLLQQNAPAPRVTQGVLTKNGLLGYIRPNIFNKGAKEMPLTPAQVDHLLKMGLSREPRADELNNPKYAQNPGLLIDTVWNNGGKQSYEAIKSNGKTSDAEKKLQTIKDALGIK